MKNKGEKFVEAMCTSERFRFYISLNFLRIYIDERSEYKIHSRVNFYYDSNFEFPKGKNSFRIPFEFLKCF